MSLLTQWKFMAPYTSKLNKTLNARKAMSYFPHSIALIGNTHKKNIRDCEN